MLPEDKRVIIVKSSGRLHDYINYACRQIADESIDHIKLIANGNAISKCVSLAEILKRKENTLNQTCSLDTADAENTPRLTIKLEKEKQDNGAPNSNDMKLDG